MIVIPAVVTQDPTLGPVDSPATPIPDDAIAVIFDGTNYTVYEPGDTVPSIGD